VNVSRAELVGLIVDGCRARHGDGRRFIRGDDVSARPDQVERRARFVAEHPELDETQRAAILDGAIMPGMPRALVVVAWSLDVAPPKDPAVRKTSEGGRTYAMWTGFDVGVIYTLYMIDDALAGVVETAQPSKTRSTRA
jgi:hypothetical protein